jgi:putative glycosyltransferase (TIGR04372 family)
LAQKIEGKFSSDIIDIVYFYLSTSRVANKQYLKMWKRRLHVIPLIFNPLLESIQKKNESLPGGKTIYYEERLDFTSLSNMATNNNITESILKQVNPPISFTSKEETLGQASLRELGIPEGTQFICFHARESVYLDKIYPKRNWSYHDFRDSNIINYLPAVEEMVKRDYYAIRMGSSVKQSLNLGNPQIIDYASNGRWSDFLDIYLSANCRFFILSDTGLSNPPEVFRTSIVYVNDFLFALLNRLSVRNGLFIFKKFYLVKEKRFITFHEILSFKNNGFEYSFNNQIDKGEIKVIDNTEEEILSATLEMDDRLKGTWETNEEDEVLQAHFWSLIPKGLLKSPNCRIGTKFLRKNQDLLDA